MLAGLHTHELSHVFLMIIASLYARYKESDLIW